MLQPNIVKTVKRIPQTFSKYFHQYFKFKTYKTWDGGSYRAGICFRKTANVENIFSLERPTVQEKSFQDIWREGKVWKDKLWKFSVKYFLHYKEAFGKKDIFLIEFSRNQLTKQIEKNTPTDMNEVGRVEHNKNIFLKSLQITFWYSYFIKSDWSCSFSLSVLTSDS